MAELNVTLIVPQFGRAELTVNCLQSFRAAHGLGPKILVVDDGSPREDVSAIERVLRPGDILLRQPHRGVTAAWNQGWRTAVTEFLVFLNNDTVTEGPWLENLLAPLVRREALITGVQGRVDRQLTETRLAYGEAPQLLAGWCLALRRRTVQELGGFDPALELYFSDTDFQLRLLRDHGIGGTLQVAAGLPLVHAGHATAHRLPDQRRQWLRDRRRFLRKWSLPRGPGDSDSD